MGELIPFRPTKPDKPREIPVEQDRETELLKLLEEAEQLAVDRDESGTIAIYGILRELLDQEIQNITEEQN